MFVVIDGKRQLHLFHEWSPWTEDRMELTSTPLGFSYPEEVRGKTFTVTVAVQKRSCRICNKTQVVRVWKGCH